MAKVTFIEPYDTVQGKFSKKSNLVNKLTPYKKQIAHRMGKRDLKERPYSQDEVTAHRNFTTIAKAVSKRMDTMSSTYGQDMGAFMAQRDEAGGIKRFRAWLWRQEKAKLGA